MLKFLIILILIAYVLYRVGGFIFRILSIGAVNADSGHIVPYNGTIVGATYHCEDDNGNTKELILYINTSSNATLFTTDGSSGDQSGVDNTLNIDVTAGDKLRIRAGTTGTAINDTIVTLYVKWRV